jgi:hypothetical protein
VPKRRSATSHRTVFRDARGKFTRPNGRKIVTRETYLGDQTSKVFSTARGRFKAPPKKIDIRKIAPARTIFEGTNHGQRFEDLLSDNNVTRKLKNVRRVVVQIETYYPGKKATPIRVIREMLLATKGKNKAAQNRMILLKALIHSLDGKGLKLYARKHLPKNEQQRYFAANQRKTQIKIIALQKGSQYRRPDSFGEVDIKRWMKRHVPKLRKPKKHR